MRLRSTTLRRATVPVLLMALAACGGEDKSPAELVQAKEYAAAVEAIAKERATVEKGSEAEAELVLLHVEATADDDPESAKSTFLGFAEAYPEAVGPRDYQAAVDFLRTYGKFVPAIEVMHAGKERWPEDAIMQQLLERLQQDAKSDPEADSALKGLGYA